MLVYSWTLCDTLLCYSHTVCWCTVDIIHYVALLQSHCVLVYRLTLYTTLLCYSHTVCWCTVGHYTLRCSVTVTLCVGVQLDIIHYVALLQSHCVLVYSWTLYTTLLCYSHTVCWCTVGHYTLRCSVTVTLCAGVQLDIIHYVALLQSHCVLVYSWTLYTTLLCYSHTVCWCTVGHYTLRCSVTVTLCAGVQLDIIHYVALLQSHRVLVYNIIRYVALLQSHRVLVYSWTLYTTLLCYSHTVCVSVQLDSIRYIALLQSHRVLVYSWTLYTTLLCYSHTVCWFTTLYDTLLCYSHTMCWCTVGHYTLRCSVTVTPCAGVQLDIIHYVALLQSHRVLVYSWTLYTTLLCYSHTVCWFTVGHYTVRCSVTVTPYVNVQLDIMNH